MIKEKIQLRHLAHYLADKITLVCSLGEDKEEITGELVAIDSEGFNGVNQIKVKYYRTSKKIPIYAAFALDQVKPILSSCFTKDNFDVFNLISKGFALDEKEFTEVLA